MADLLSRPRVAELGPKLPTKWPNLATLGSGTAIQQLLAAPCFSCSKGGILPLGYVCGKGVGQPDWPEVLREGSPRTLPERPRRTRSWRPIGAASNMWTRRGRMNNSGPGARPGPAWGPSKSAPPHQANAGRRHAGGRSALGGGVWASARHRRTKISPMSDEPHSKRRVTTPAGPVGAMRAWLWVGCKAR